MSLIDTIELQDDVETTLKSCTQCKESAVKKYYEMKKENMMFKTIINELEHNNKLIPIYREKNIELMARIDDLEQQLENAHEGCPDCDSCDREPVRNEGME